ncbi:MAG: hypothetical protein M1814_003645 [Vezdaea aestivalis]|nr:MAG: hypothetical protein M1814_003645 [Vezdaea aestivalis]
MEVLSVGSGTGVAGLMVGSVYGILRSQRPVLFASVYGLQCFAAGTVFWGSRSTALWGWATEHPTSTQKVLATTQAGALTGGLLNLVQRGRRHIIISMLTTGFLAGSIQGLSNFSQPLKLGTALQDTKSKFRSIASSQWSPVKSLSDEEYVSVIKERILKLDVEIALVEDSIKDYQGKVASNDSSTHSGSPPE